MALREFGIPPPLIHIVGFRIQMTHGRSSKFIVQFNAAVKTGRAAQNLYHVHLSSWHRSVNKSPELHL